MYEQPGTSGARRADAARQRALEHAAEAAKWQQLADKYAKGDAGERAVAQLLDVLDGTGWVVLNDRYKAAGSPANIDHILIGPPGICVIDTKNWAGPIAVDARGLTAKGWRRDTALQQAAEMAGIVEWVARQSVPGVITAPVLCFVGDVGLAAPVYEHGVVVLQADQMLAWLTSLTRNLEPHEVARLGSALSAHFWPRTEKRSRLVAPRAAAAPRSMQRGRATSRPAPVRRPPVRESLGDRALAAMDNAIHALGSLALRLIILGVAALLCLTLLPKVLTAVLTSAIPHPSPTATPQPIPRPTVHR